ncbi:MAG: HEAT repeat domain-containing protein [Deltaproteobacteria bacterium]|nr:HEAT repeat domain-containing protein [Deltaproteobacteria bacterium]
MPQQLTQVLLENRIISVETLNEALQRQVIFGGSIDTNIFEVSDTSEHILLKYLGIVTGLPTIDKQQIDQIAEHIPRLFPLVFAETYHLVPFRLVEQELLVLLNEAPDQQLLERISERLRLKAVAVVTTEVRLHYAMHHVYGTALLPRFANLLKRLDGDLPTSFSESNEHVLSWGLTQSVITPTSKLGNKQRQSLDVRSVLKRLDAAIDRDNIVEALLGAAISVFEFAGLFAIHSERINGWRGATPADTQRVARISLSVELPSVFQTIYATGGHYLGPLIQNSINTKLLDDMGREIPRAALLAPIFIGDKMAAILYADNGKRVVSSRRVAAILLLIQRTGVAFERLIRRQKQNPDNELANIASEPAQLDFNAMTVSAEGETWVVQNIVPPQSTANYDNSSANTNESKVNEASYQPVNNFTSSSYAITNNHEFPANSPIPTAVAIGRLSKINKKAVPIDETVLNNDELSEPTMITNIGDTLAPSINVQNQTESTINQGDSTDNSLEPWGIVSLSEIGKAEVSINISDEIIIDPDIAVELDLGEFNSTALATPASKLSSTSTPIPIPIPNKINERPATKKKPPEHSDYQIFADVSDSPKAALDDWQDVLIETAGLDSSAFASSQHTQNTPPSVTWDDVIAEAERAQKQITPTAAVEVAGKVIDTREFLFDSLEAQNPEIRRDAIEKLLALGTSIDDELHQRFPGRLLCDPLSENDSLPLFRACSGLLELIAARGASAAAIVLPHLESPNALHRLFAIYYLYTVQYPPALAALTRRLYDAEPKNRYLAAETLRLYAHDHGYPPIVQNLREQLRVPVIESQVAAVQILGQLREPTAVPSLIPLVVAKRSELAMAAISALAVICGRNLGADVANWASWWQKNYNRPRPVWLIESLRDANLETLHMVHNELVLLSGTNPEIDFAASGSREKAIATWEAWWTQLVRSSAMQN